MIYINKLKQKNTVVYILCHVLDNMFTCEVFFITQAPGYSPFKKPWTTSMLTIQINDSDVFSIFPIPSPTHDFISSLLRILLVFIFIICFNYFSSCLEIFFFVFFSKRRTVRGSRTFIFIFVYCTIVCSNIPTHGHWPERWRQRDNV